jgi:hypothetical protein
MTQWRAFLNDRIPDCGVAACCNAMLLWNTASPSDADAQLANDRFSSADYNSKVLWGWLRRGIGGNKLGGFARIKPSQIPDAIARFGCVFAALNSFEGVGPHAVLMTKTAIVSWGREYTASDGLDFSEVYAIAPKFHPILIWWALTNNPRWFLFLAPLWLPQ